MWAALALILVWGANFTVQKAIFQALSPGGFLFVASCSHHAPLDLFTAQVAGALLRARRDARIVHTGGAGPDHPVHPQLPESAYLKSLLLQLT